MRRDVHWVEVRWYYRTTPADPGTAPSAETGAAFLKDLSIVGAALTAPRTPHVSVGDVIGLEFHGTNGEVTVRRIDPDPDAAELMVYGVEFTDRVSPLTAALRDEFFDRALFD